MCIIIVQHFSFCIEKSVVKFDKRLAHEVIHQMRDMFLCWDKQVPYAKQNFKLSFKLNEKQDYYLLEFDAM
jgi:hypothetical protein